MGWWGTGWATAIGTGAGAVGTVGALWVAVIGLAGERRARREDERAALKRATQAHAEGIAAWVSSGPPLAGLSPTAVEPTVVALQNDSSQPAYMAVVSLVMIQGAGAHRAEDLVEGPFWRQTVAVVPPGRSYITLTGGWQGMMRRPGIDVAFVDQHGHSWMRRANGQLEQLPAEPALYLRLPMPQAWVLPTPQPPSADPMATTDRGAVPGPAANR